MANAGIDKLEAKIAPETVEAMRGMSPEELDERIVSLAKHEKETEDALDKDDKIKELKEELKELQAPYKETMKSIKAQRTFAVLLLEEKGKA